MSLPTDSPRRATRDTHDVWLGGVASGLALHLGMPTMWVRAGFLAFAALGGVGVAFYAGLWMALPTDARFDHEAPGLASATRSGKRPRRKRRLSELGPIVAIAALGIPADRLPPRVPMGSIAGGLSETTAHPPVQV